MPDSGLYLAPGIPDPRAGPVSKLGPCLTSPGQCPILLSEVIKILRAEPTVLPEVELRLRIQRNGSRPLVKDVTQVIRLLLHGRALRQEVEDQPSGGRWGFGQTAELILAMLRQPITFREPDQIGGEPEDVLVELDRAPLDKVCGSYVKIPIASRRDHGQIISDSRRQASRCLEFCLVSRWRLIGSMINRNEANGEIPFNSDEADIAEDYARQVTGGHKRFAEFLASVKTLVQLFRAYASGDFEMTWTEVFVLITALAYVVNPVDVLPEAALGPAGLPDDVAAVVGAVSALAAAIMRFRQPRKAAAGGTHSS